MFPCLLIASLRTNRCISLPGATSHCPVLGMSRYNQVMIPFFSTIQSTDFFIYYYFFKVRNTNCTRGRITLRVDGRSRLADVKGCTKGYYTVFPFMMQAKYVSPHFLIPHSLLHDS